MQLGVITIVYGLTALCALSLMLVYLRLAKKSINLLLLYVSVFVVNMGYFAMSISRSLPEIMLANRFAYLGSVFLPLCMLLIIQDACRIRCSKAALGGLIAFSILVFLLAASGGYCGLYYKEVSMEIVEGSAVLNKVYGPLHVVYLIYLVAYFAMMIATIVWALVRKKITSPKLAIGLAAMVLGNIAVWFVEQKIDLDFEFLAVSYIMTEVVLLFLYDILLEFNTMQDKLQKLTEAEHAPAGEISPAREDPADEAQAPAEEEAAPVEKIYVVVEEQYLTPEAIRRIMEEWPGLQTLTSREVEVLHALLENRRRRDIAEAMFVSENTVKKHTSNIFAKVGVTNRRELCLKLEQETAQTE